MKGDNEALTTTKALTATHDNKSDDKSDTTIDARSDASNEDLVASAQALIAISESPSAPSSESPVTAAKTLLLLHSRDVRAAGALRTGEARTVTGKSTKAGSKAPEETARLVHLAHNAYIDTLMIPRCPVQRSAIALQQTWDAKNMRYVLGSRMYRRPAWQRTMWEWVERQMESEGMGMGEWEVVCEE